MLVWAISRTDLDKVDAKLNRAFVATPAASMIEATASSFEDELCFVALLLLLLLQYLTSLGVRRSSQKNTADEALPYAVGTVLALSWNVR